MNAISKLELDKWLLSPPGDTIQEHIEFIGMPQAELAERLARPKEKINDLIKGRERLTTETAKQLEVILGIPANFWLNREQEYRRKLHEIEQRQEALEKHKFWLEAFPVASLQEAGYLPQGDDAAALLEGLFQFFAVASPKGWENVYMSNRQPSCFPVSLEEAKNPYALSAWLRIGERQAEKIKLGNFDKKQFKNMVLALRDFRISSAENFAQQLQTICAEAGVALVYTATFEGVEISGSVRWYRQKPIIQIAEPLLQSPDFWKHFFHQAAHLFLHGKKDIFLENVEGIKQQPEKEAKAQAFAAKMC